MSKTRYINFLPSAMVGMTEKEFRQIASFIEEVVKKKDLDVFVLIDYCMQIQDGEIEDRFIDAFENYCAEKNMQINEGLTHPYEWIRNLSKCLAEKNKRS